ncbi:BREX-2 system adenine-specific DNA-methyltransferase PglX [Actinomadura litoris]|uniref:BREX-2 system adenine-specific DNA-methyltransferase PglX n=1 Tax=Actinomadura litoris TaxID=2678616 RepID=UPI001FA737B7|nr:BREX-2 system adenine-specific DNA-methyltransferase PglX [Actinomadura litoris]
MIDPDALLNDLKPQVRALENDLRERAAESSFDEPLRKEWNEAVRRSRTAATYETWLDDQITQSAVAWVLNTVFLRFCEDNRLIDDVFLSGPGERLDLARERQQFFFEKPENASLTDREWIEEGLKVLGKASPVAAGLFDRDHNPMWRITPSLEGAKALITFWRLSRTVEEDGAEAATVPVHDFTDPSWNTRFLGDLYQDLSQHAKEKYALLQTPEFVEEFILGLTLDEAINEFGLDPEPPEACPEELNLPRGLRVIDPTCGSGHFLLGAFEHIYKKLSDGSSEDRWDLVHRALYSVHGVDKNPFAVAIARFRLLIAAMKAGKVRKFLEAPKFTLNVAVGDSLIHGRGGPELDQGRWEFTESGELLEPGPVFTYDTEDVSDYVKTVDLLGVGSYHVVVGNPPYITVKDKRENKNYRIYKSCSGSYALSVPFAERFFQLAIRAGKDRRGAGYVGQITANSFMKREFGKKLIEEFFPTIKLTHVIDTSGAHIPGHGTPTIILAGRRAYPISEPIRAVLSIQGEPSEPADPANGHVWRAIVDQVQDPGSSSDWVSVIDLPPGDLRRHPWTLSGGGASELLSAVSNQPNTLSTRMLITGRTTHTGLDAAFYLPKSAARTYDLAAHSVPVVLGEGVRDYYVEAPTWTLFPYEHNGDPRDLSRQEERFFWSNRTALRMRVDFGEHPEERGLRWFDHSMFFPKRFTNPLSIAFAFVATHNHFVFDRGGKVFNRSSPVIKLVEDATESDYIELAGVLNSSTACFWLKQVSHDKGSQGVNEGFKSQGWERFYEYTGTKLASFPIPADYPSLHAHEASTLVQRALDSDPASVCAKGIPKIDRMQGARETHDVARQKMIAILEELDWEVYRLYSLLNEGEAAELVADPEVLPGVKLGERAFEIVLARKVAAGEVETQWFARHGSTPVTEIPEHWPEAYRRVVEKRIEMIETRPRTIGLIERPEYKRRWATEPWEKKEKDALRGWLLDRCEARELWFTADETGSEQPKPMTVGRLADRFQDDADFVSVARLYAGEDVELLDVLTEILDAEHVPFIPALRYKDSGLRKRAQWEETWRLQRQEDATGERLDIKVPPKYTSADFVKNSYWRNRGKLDVPKERFISYPGASPDGDKTLLIGWAGWDHSEQARALVMLIEERTTRDGWELERLMPLLAGLDEVLPWVKQWHGDVDPATGLSPAVAYEGYLQQQLERHALPREELAKWRPAKKARGRAASKKAAE